MGKSIGNNMDTGIIGAAWPSSCEDSLLEESRDSGVGG